jgi:hypothetical protein
MSPNALTLRLYRLLVLSLAVFAATAFAEPTLDEGGRFEVRSAFLEPAERVYQLNATIDLTLSRAFQQAIEQGVPVELEVDLTVDRKRSYLPDKQVAAIAQRWHIQYHALSERFLITNDNSGQSASYATLNAALLSLSQIRGLPVVDEALIEKGGRYEGSLRVTTTVEGGLPSALKVMMFWMDWKRSTDWYTWSVVP